MQTKTKRAKRRLTDITFDAPDAHVSLVSTDVGGPANGRDTALVIKSARSKEFIEKIQQVRVSMELDDFIKYFFNVYGTQADMLAAMMGYNETESDDDTGMFHPDKSFYEWRCDKWEMANPGMECPDEVKWAEETDAEYKQYIDEMLAGIEVIKSLAAQSDIKKAISELDEETHLALVKKQAKFEAAEKRFKAEQSVAKSKNTKETTMPQANGADSGATDTHIEKSVHESVLKQLQDANEKIEALSQELTVLKSEKQEQINKARFEKLKDAVKDEAVATTLFKSMKSLDDAEFNASIEALAKITKQTDETNALLQELGANGQGAVAPKQESAVAKAVKARQAKAA